MVLDFRPVAEESYHIEHNTPEKLAGVMKLGKGAAGPPVHVHPHSAEKLELLEGKLRIHHGGTWKTIEAGATWEVSAGEPHTFAGHPDEGATVRFQVTPNQGFADFLQDTHELIRAGKLKSYESLDGLIYSSMLVKKYPQDFQAAQWPMRIVMNVASWVGKAMGRRV